MSDALADSKVAEAANAAAVAKEADHRAYVEATRAMLREEMSPEKGRYVDVTRIPLICQAIVGIDKRLGGIEDNQKWVTRLIIGAVIAALLALILK